MTDTECDQHAQKLRNPATCIWSGPSHARRSEIVDRIGCTMGSRRKLAGGTALEGVAVLQETFPEAHGYRDIRACIQV